jgi:amidase
MAFQTTTDLVAALRARKVSAVELLDAAIARIESGDARLNAVVVRDFERARTQALAADAALARGEQGALLGVPMTVKESFNVAGLATTWGIPGTEAGRAQGDAVGVARLKAAGAVVLGKTNVSTNLGDWQCFNPVYGLTRNPWDPARTPGGSSGGAAAALAAGFVPLELGSDLGGSLRVPAHCCGIFAHKPTLGLVPVRGHAPPGAPDLSIALDGDLGVAGPLARSADDLTLALDVLAGPDDAQALAYRLTLPPPRRTRLRDYKVLVLTEHPRLPLADEVRAGIERYADGLRRVGCVLGQSSAKFPDLATIGDTFTRLLMSFIGAGLPEGAYRRLAAKAANLPAGDADDERLRALSIVASHREWMSAQRTRLQLSHQCRELFRDWDLVLCPVLPLPAIAHDQAEMELRRIDIDGRSFPYAAQAAWLGMASVCGLPATVMPIGTGVSGLPIGIQIIGPYLEDRSTLGFAALAEREFGGFAPPPGWTI